MKTITLKLDYNHPMAAEEYSLYLAYTSFVWALSMISLLAAIIKLSSLTRKK